ncbi:hypothetical protein HK096_004664 [Nowakowskiella sp. JEL0078]|nr:hypothetical protein HK096_004664 [Nowakowskiella sp. JEL0078]
MLIFPCGTLFSPQSQVCNGNCCKEAGKYILEDDDKILEQKHIPHIIHQSWKTKVLPFRFQEWTESWKTKNPGWKHILWTDTANRMLVQNHFPWFLPVYDSLPKPIARADAVRYMYLYKFGGVYADLDVEALKPMEELILHVRRSLNDENWKKRTINQKTTLISNGAHKSIMVIDTLHTNELHAAYPPNSHFIEPELLLPLMGHSWTFPHNIPNAWMASRPGHSFWMHCLALISKKVEEWQKTVKKNPHAKLNIEGLTGPMILYEAWHRYIKEVHIRHQHPIILLEPGVIFPYDWRYSRQHRSVCSAEKITFNSEICKIIFNATGKPDEKAFTISYWSHSWEGKRNKVIEKNSTDQN